MKLTGEGIASRQATLNAWCRKVNQPVKMVSAMTGEWEIDGKLRLCMSVLISLEDGTRAEIVTPITKNVILE